MTQKINKTRRDSGLPTYSSMQACEGATGIPKAAMQEAKRAGCDAFDPSNRVSLEPLLRWIFRADADEANIDWAMRHKRALALAAELELEATKGRMVEIEAVHEREGAIAAKAMAVLVAKFEVELPPRCAGAPADRIADINREALNEVRTILGVEDNLKQASS